MPDPFFALLPLFGGLVVGCWLLSVVTREYSWVDRLWSVAPPMYFWVMSWRTDFADARLTLMSVLATAWGVRLTYNFARKGGYRRGGEDYRWLVLRERLGPVLFQVFNATFIAPIQNGVLLMICAVASTVWQAHSPLTVADWVLASVFLLALTGETIADQQQWNFQRAKAERKLRNESGPEFCTTGLFRYSRHPNFFFEVTMWWLMYGFGIIATQQPFHWSIVGPLLLTSIFEGSTRFTEQISKSKYPSYSDYQATTSRLLPMPPNTEARI